MAKITVPVPPLFWSAYEADNLEVAGSILGDALKHRTAAEGRDNSILARHLPHYATDQFIFDDASIAVDGVKWNEGTRSGIIQARFHESRKQACGFGAEIQDDKREPLFFGIEDKRPNGEERNVWIEVLEAPIYFSPE